MSTELLILLKKVCEGGFDRIIDDYVRGAGLKL
jgi:hypothetical protein